MIRNIDQTGSNHPTVTANNCEMFYEIDDFTDPWVKDKETVRCSTVSVAAPSSGITGCQH
jgi:hypothetical protein